MRQRTLVINVWRVPHPWIKDLQRRLSTTSHTCQNATFIDTSCLSVMNSTLQVSLPHKRTSSEVEDRKSVISLYKEYWKGTSHCFYICVKRDGKYSASFHSVQYLYKICHILCSEHTTARNDVISSFLLRVVKDTWSEQVELWKSYSKFVTYKLHEIILLTALQSLQIL